MPDFAELAKYGVGTLALLVCIALVLILAKKEGLFGKKNDTEVGPLKPSLDSGRIIAATLEQHGTPLPEHWREDVAQIGMESAMEVVSTLEQRDVPLPGHWHRIVRAEAEHKVNNAVAPLVLQISVLEKAEREGRDLAREVLKSQRAIEGKLDELMRR